jgi:very-short-patch-repair endonuclease
MNVIKWKLGDDWEVIRINTDNINTNITKLIPGSVPY